MSTLRNGPVLVLTRQEIANLEPNKPTKRVYGTDASLSWEDQVEYIRKASSKAVTRLYAMLDSVAEGAEVAEIVRALSQAQAMAIKALSKDDPGQEPTDEQLMKRVPK
jgi:hypothetical protein